MIAPVDEISPWPEWNEQVSGTFQTKWQWSSSK